MKKVITFLSQTKVLLMTAGIFGILCILSNTIFQSDFTYLTQTFNYSFYDVQTLLSNIGSTGRTAHQLILIADFFMILSYTTFLLGINYRLSCAITKNCHIITLITFAPLLLSLVQLLEIIGMGAMLFRYPALYPTFIKTLNTLTMTKYCFTTIFFILPFLLFGYKMVITKRKGRMIHAK